MCVQIDNQLSDAYYPTVLSPAPLPSYIIKKRGPKPFIELGLMRRTVPENNVDTIRSAPAIAPNNFCFVLSSCLVIVFVNLNLRGIGGWRGVGAVSKTA